MFNVSGHLTLDRHLHIVSSTGDFWDSQANIWTTVRCGQGRSFKANLVGMADINVSPATGIVDSTVENFEESFPSSLIAAEDTEEIE